MTTRKAQSEAARAEAAAQARYEFLCRSLARVAVDATAIIDRGRCRLWQAEQRPAEFIEFVLSRTR